MGCLMTSQTHGPRLLQAVTSGTLWNRNSVDCFCESLPDMRATPKTVPKYQPGSWQPLIKICLGLELTMSALSSKAVL
jgi:hypothetical protein